MLATTSRGKEMIDDLTNFIVTWTVVLLPVAGLAYFFCKRLGFLPGMPLRLIALSTPGLLLTAITLYFTLDSLCILIRKTFVGGARKMKWLKISLIILLSLGYCFDQAAVTSGVGAS